jgi:very-short-patch-repair endonuclease
VDERLVELARTQGGLITRRQALDLGTSDEDLAALVSDAALTRVKRGRYRVHDVDTWEDRVRGLALLAGAAAVAARGTAARLHEIEGPPTADGITFYVPRSANVVRRPGLSVLRCDVSPRQICTAKDIACTSALRTVVDCARFLPHPNAVATIEGAVRKELVALDDVTTAIAELQRVAGAPAARRALLRVDLRSQSSLETEARLLLLDAGVDVEPQVELGNWHADLGVRNGRLAIELQGGTHREKAQQQEDETKRAAFLASNWEIVGFTADDVRKRPAYVVAVVRRLLDVRRRAG